MNLDELVTQAEKCVQDIRLSAPEASIILLAEAIRRLNVNINSLEHTLATLLKNE